MLKLHYKVKKTPPKLRFQKIHSLHHNILVSYQKKIFFFIKIITYLNYLQGRERQLNDQQTRDKGKKKRQETKRKQNMSRHLQYFS